MTTYLAVALAWLALALTGQATGLRLVERPNGTLAVVHCTRPGEAPEAPDAPPCGDPRRAGRGGLPAGR